MRGKGENNWKEPGCFDGAPIDGTVVFRPRATRQHVIEAGLGPGIDRHYSVTRAPWPWLPRRSRERVLLCLTVVVVAVEMGIAFLGCRECNVLDTVSEP